jgi:hypothetical protein
MLISKRKKKRKQEMSKGLKKKISVKLMPGQAVFVADVEVLQHIAETYVYLAETCDSQEEKDSWLTISQDVISWIKETYHSGQEDEQEEEW